jgi:hypothetical protein
MSDTLPRPSYSRDDVLSQEEVRAALPPMGDSKWLDVCARIPWSDQIGRRKPCIRWGALLDWIDAGSRKSA